MLLHIDFLSECSAAVVTVERFLSSVGSDMVDKIILFREKLAAFVEITLIILATPFCYQIFLQLFHGVTIN
jgi:hypothetical protein